MNGLLDAIKLNSKKEREQINLKNNQAYKTDNENKNPSSQEVMGSNPAVAKFSFMHFQTRKYRPPKNQQYIKSLKISSENKS